MANRLDEDSKIAEAQSQPKSTRKPILRYVGIGILVCSLLGLLVFYVIPNPDRGWKLPRKDGRSNNRTKNKGDFDKANKAIQKFVSKHQRLPTDEEGQALIEGKFRDNTYSQIQYEKTDKYRYGFRTDGYDGVLWTPDDICHSHFVDKSTIKIILPTPKFKDFVEAEKGIDASGSWVRNAALQWFIDNNMDIGTRHKSQIIVKVLKHPENELFQTTQHFDDKLIKSFLPDFDKLYHRAVADDAIDLERFRILRTVIEFWAETGDKFSFKRYVNRGIKEIEAEIASGLATLQISDEELARWCLRDLKNDAYIKSAMKRLASINLAPEKEKEVRSRLFQVLSTRPSKDRGTSFQQLLKSRSFSFQTLKTLIERFGDVSNLDDMFAWIRNEPEYAGPVLEQLVEKNDEQIYEKLVLALENDDPFAQKVFAALSKSGNHFENVLIDKLSSGSQIRQIRICSLLAKCGSEAGLEALNRFESSCENGEVKKAAGDAIERLKKRLSDKSKK